LRIAVEFVANEFEADFRDPQGCGAGSVAMQFDLDQDIELAEVSASQPMPWIQPSNDCLPMKQRRRIKQTVSLQERLASWVRDIRERAAAMPPGPERDALLRKAGQAETACHLDEWINSSGLKPPQ
jgi:hypothetical protein